MALGSGQNIKLATIFYELEARTSGLKKDVQESQDSLGRLSEFIKANPMVAVAALGAAIVGIGAKALMAAADFESQMAKVNTVANVSKDELAKLAGQVGDLFKKYPVEDTKTLTDGLYQIVSSGISAKDAMQVLDVATRTAVGGFTSTETVVDALTSVMNAYKSENLSAAEVSDVLAKAVANGKIEMNEIAGSIGQVVGIAATFGVSIQEVSAVLAQLSLGGIKTAEGITGLRSAITNILRPAESFRKEFPKLSEAFDENRLKRDGFVKFLLDFQSESGGSSEALKGLIRDTQGYNAVVSLLKDGGAGLTRQLEDMKNASGSVDAAFQKVNETANAQYQILKNNLSATFIDLGNRILPAVNTALGLILSLLERINGEAAKREAAKAMETIADRIAKVAGVTSSSGTEMQDALKKVSKDALLLANDFDAGRLKLQEFNKTELTDLSKQFLALSNNPLVTDYMEQRFLRLAQVAANAASRMKDVGTATTETIPPVTTLGTTTTATAEQLEEAQRKTETFAKKVKEAVKDAAKAAKEAFESYEKSQKRLSARLADAVVAATETMVDDMSLALERGIDELIDMGATADQIAQFKGLKQGAIDAQKNIERIAQAVKDLGKTSNNVDLLGYAVKRVNELIAEQNAIRIRPGVSDAERIAAEKNIGDLTGTRVELEGRIATIKTNAGKAAKTDATDERVEAERSLKAVAAKANAIQVAGTGAVKLAASFGLISEGASKTLQDVIAIGTQVVTLAKATGDLLSSTAKGAAEGGLWGAVIAASLSLAGTIGSLIGAGDKAQKERTRVTNANTRAVEMLTKVQGDLLRINLSGRDFGKSRDALQQFLDRFKNRGDFREFGKKGLEGIDPSRELERLGINFEDIKEIAKTFGITLDGQIGSYRRLLDAIKAADLKGFVDTFSGQLERLETEFEVRAENFKTPADKLAALIKLLNSEKGASGLFDAIGKLDVSTVEGQNKAIEEIQKLLDKLDSGELTPEELGNLSLQEFKDIIKRLNSEVRSLLEDSAKAGDSKSSGDKTPPKEGDKTPPKEGDKTPTPEKTPPGEDTTVESLKALSIALREFSEFVVALSDVSRVATLRIKELSTELGLLGKGASTGTVGLVAPTLSSNATDAIVSAIENSKPLAPVINKTVNLTIQVILPQDGVVIGNMDQLADAIGQRMSDIVSKTISRDVTHEEFIIGDRKVSVK